MSVVRILLFSLACLWLAGGSAQAGEKRGRSDFLGKSFHLNSAPGFEDRAQSVINANKLGQVVTNLGQFHAYTGALPQGRWPLGTDHDAIWKISLFVGIPFNVVQSRANQIKEWDAMSGYHNPDSGYIAVSTNPLTWPRDPGGNPYWPVRTPDGRDSINSQMDSYAVYTDSTNNLAVNDPTQRLRVVIHQTSYAWNTSKDDDYIIFKFEMINDTTAAKDELYFGIYNDIDAGGIIDEYDDDYIGLELNRQFWYVYDSDNYSRDWQQDNPFYLGMVWLETPEINGQRPGITDWHYSSVFDSPWGDVLTEDKVVYNWMRSDSSLRNDTRWPNLFHGNDLHYDDPSLVPAGGMAVDCIAASGPYHMEPGETLTFAVALVAGADYQDISANVDRVWQIYNNGLKLIPPPQPQITGFARDNSIRLAWSNAQEFSYINPQSGESLVQEYRVYKTTDPTRQEWGEPFAIIPRRTDLNEIKEDAYVWEDPETVNNYFYYSYSVTTYDVDGLESGRANLGADQTVNLNTTELRPVDSPRQNLNEVRVVPNPYVISALWERKRLGDPLLGEPIRDIAFINLPERCTIKIFTLDGDLVKTIEHTNGTGTEFWDIRSNFNQILATGVYFYHIRSASGEKIGKFAIVR